MDLPKNDIGVELKNRTFEPELIVSPGKDKVVDQLHQKAGAEGRTKYFWRLTRTAKAKRLRTICCCS